MEKIKLPLRCKNKLINTNYFHDGNFITNRDFIISRDLVSNAEKICKSENDRGFNTFLTTFLAIRLMDVDKSIMVEYFSLGASKVDVYDFKECKNTTVDCEVFGNKTNSYEIKIIKPYWELFFCNSEKVFGFLDNRVLFTGDFKLCVCGIVKK